MPPPLFPFCLAIRITSLIVHGILSVLVAVIIAAGNAVASLLTSEFLGNYFKNRNYYEIEADGFALDHMSLMTPDNQRNLIRDLTMALDRRVNLVVVGPSGVGKSSLLRAIAGLWTRGEGIVRRPPLHQRRSQAVPARLPRPGT